MDEDGDLADRIRDAFERGAANARHAERTLAKLAHDQGWDPADAAQHFMTAAATQVLLASEHSEDRVEVATEGLLAFAVSMELVDPDAIPRCLESLAARDGDLDPELDACIDALFEAAEQRRRHDAS